MDADPGRDDDPIPISALQHLLYCPRQFALIHLERQWVENQFTAEGRWRALTLQALGDGLADATVRRNQEKRLSEDKRSAAVIEHQAKAIETSFGVLERAVLKFPSEPTIGEIAVAAALGYLDLRVPEEGWRNRFPNLARWMEEFSKRPSFIATIPPG